MEADEIATGAPGPSSGPAADAAEGQADTDVPVRHEDIGAWRGRDLFDRDGERIGKLRDVYYDVETEEPQFGTLTEGWLGRHLTFVPLIGVTIGPDRLQVTVSKEQLKGAPNIDVEGDELSPAQESQLYHHYELNYTPPDRESGRRLVRH